MSNSTMTMRMAMMMMGIPTVTVTASMFFPPSIAGLLDSGVYGVSPIESPNPPEMDADVKDALGVYLGDLHSRITVNVETRQASRLNARFPARETCSARRL